MIPINPNMRSHRSGVLGEQFCKEMFGVTEPRYEVKSTGATNGAFVVQAWQLFESLWKQYIVVHYKRSKKTISRGPNKGKTKFTETIEEAYKKQLDVFVVRGHRLAQIVLDKKLTLYCTARNGDLLKYGKFGLVYRIPRSELEGLELFEETDHYRLFCYSDDPPQWAGDEAASTIEGGLFASGNGQRKKKEEEDEVPF